MGDYEKYKNKYLKYKNKYLDLQILLNTKKFIKSSPIQMDKSVYIIAK